MPNVESGKACLEFCVTALRLCRSVLFLRRRILLLASRYLLRWSVMRVFRVCLTLWLLAPTSSWAQGFYGVTRVTPMAPARGVFFGSQGLGAGSRVTPTVSTFRTPGPLLAKRAKVDSGKTKASSDRLEPQVLALIRKRASQGSMVDQYRMGLVFARGLAGKRDLELARRWFAVAAERRYAPAISALKALNRLSEPQRH